jgi:predicted TIM-barrel fold metal-dependent hydrolase
MTEKRSLLDLPLRDFRPEPMVRLAQHHPQRFPVPAFDSHNHLGRWHLGTWTVPDVDELLAVMDECHINGIVNLDGGWADELEANLNRYDRAHPGRFASFCRLDWSETKTAGWGERLAASLRDSASRGASGLKLWKDVGLRLRDENGEAIFLDDPRLKPVWDAVAEARLPIIVHIADPAAFFQPLDASNERYEELARHPDWHFYGPEFPSLARLLESLEHCVAENPQVNIIGAHVGCYAEDLSWVDRMLSSYPNFNVDIGARIAELGRQPRAARRLMLKHSNRVLMGTDSFPPQAEVYRRYLRFLSTDDEYFSYSESDPPGTGRWMISAVDLPDEVLASVVSGNARRLIPAFWGDART